MNRDTEEKILFVLVFITLVSALIYMGIGPSTVNVKAYVEETNEDRIGKMAAQYMKDEIVPPSSTVYWNSVIEKEDMYQVNLEIYDGTKMRDCTSFFTRDLKIFFPSSVDLTKTSRPISGSTPSERAFDFARKYILSYGENAEISETSYECNLNKIVITAEDKGEIVLFITDDGNTVYPQHSYM